MSSSAQMPSLTLETLLVTLSSMKGAVDESWDGQCVSPWWQQVRTACVQSKSSAAALLAALVAHRVAKNAITKLAESKVQEEWECVSLELEQWVVCIKQLEDVLALQTLLCLPSPQGSAGVSRCSVKTLLESGRGFSELLECACQHFPNSLSPDVLFAHCSWENVVQWNKDPEVGQYLEWSVEFLKMISNPHIQLGVNTVGKAPKDRLCRRDVGMGDAAVRSFLGSCVQLLQALMEVSSSSFLPSFPFLSRADSAMEEVPPPDVGVEEVWSAADGPVSIVEMALDQRSVHFPLVQHHCVLATLLHAAMSFSLRLKPLSLFDSKGKNAFFRDLASIQLLPSGDMDPSLVAVRQEFLMNVLSAWVKALAENEENGMKPQVVENSWSSVCLELSSLLQVMMEVQDKDILGSQLLVLTGQRLSFSLLHSQSQSKPNMELLARLPPTLCTWLKAMDPSELRCPSVALPQSVRLINKVIEMLPENHAQYSLVLHLLEAVDSFQQEP
ncbi:hypothetical protein DNTS_017576 [Danionella cerebrum]|uniref:Rab3GAP regulatory subunit C-terminal domain-containing protein n=1 Tax=Danionella cerebrum TaxID=2873325 RepID=A0A553RJ68_9TELE|nr:hypothetical protein DNTS_017576 [Danionella translucida]TRZ02228.1 hypothetical protein DNTS_017576 [Danionella translucida]TRZ02229.1 hypothetical protein DNTS_017576 [Danionella translucida]TRZ02230.1 hypothetical protein DNTS_017576 [Danionella translucida]TRZ02232.1 hypothetical protein DNTS_017576 [Danionella translucida]